MAGQTELKNDCACVTYGQSAHSRPQRPCSFWSAPRIATSGHVQHRKSAIHGLPVTLRMFRIKSDKSDWFWPQYIVFTQAIQNRSVVGPGQRSRLLVLTKRSAASGNENGSRRGQSCKTIAHASLMTQSAFGGSRRNLVPRAFVTLVQRSGKTKSAGKKRLSSAFHWPLTECAQFHRKLINNNFVPRFPIPSPTPWK